MTDDRANIKVTREFFEKHNPERKKLGLDWEDYIEGNAPDIVDELPTDIVDEIGAKAGGPHVDDSEIAREVARQLDYDHLAQLVAEKVTDELR